MRPADLWIGDCVSIAKPTQSAGGVPPFQFIASGAMPSPRCTFSVNGAVVLSP